MRRAVVVRTKKTELRSDGRYVKSVLLPLYRINETEADGRFDDTACVLLNTKGDMIGTRVSGPVSSELRDIPGGAGGPAGRWSKILSLAPKVSPTVITDEAELMYRSFNLDQYTVRRLRPSCNFIRHQRPRPTMA